MPCRITFSPALQLIHVTSLGKSLSDSFLWDYAGAHQYVIVTKDADFSSRIMLSEPPPWVVRFCIGNLQRVEFHAFAAVVWPRIERLLPGHRLINVYRDRIEAIR